MAVATLIANLARALPAALIAGVLPGYFWAVFVRRTDGLGERLTYSAAVSLASVPAVALVLARILGTGVTLGIAIATVVIVAGSGAAACRIWGVAGGSAAPALPRPRAITDGRVLALIIAAIGLALAVSLGVPAQGWILILILVAVAAAGVLAGIRGGPVGGPDADPGQAVGDQAASDVAASDRAASDQAAGRPRWLVLSPRLRAPVLLTVLALTALRAYVGVVGHDWPYLRGEDQFSHAVMTEQTLAHGSYGSYLVYPPGFSATAAVICRISGLAPLTLFPVLTPALLLLTTLAAYALVTRIWGWEYGLIAAVLSGLVLVGPYVSFGGGLYPDLLAAFFLMVMVVAGLISLYQAPSVRSGLLVVVVGAAVVLFHSVGALYLALLLVGVTVVCLPYLLLRGGHEGRVLARALTLTVAGLGVLSVAYAWHIYGLGHLFNGGTTKTTVGLDVGSQSVLPAGDLLSWVGSPVIWLGVFGFAALAAAVRYLRQPAQVLCVLTLLVWCALMYIGSRTAADGFPQRFERDVGAPLSILGTLGAGLILQSVLQLRLQLRPRPTRRAVGLLVAGAAAVVVVIAGVQAVNDMVTDWAPSNEVLPPTVAAAGAWLQQHNTGGTIISTPDMNRGITNRAVLAMGGYTGLQSYPEDRIEHPRSLPTAGRGPLLDSREVLLRPRTCRSANILVNDQVRFVILYRLGNQANFAGFRADSTLYRRVFRNYSVVIYAPRQASVQDCGAASTAQAASHS
jgi:hypothetical protein